MLNVSAVVPWKYKFFYRFPKVFLTYYIRRKCLLGITAPFKNDIISNRAPYQANRTRYKRLLQVFAAVDTRMLVSRKTNYRIFET